LAGVWTQVKAEWAAAHAVIDQTIDQDRLDRLRTETEAKLAELRDEINAVNNAVWLDASDFDLPPLEVPEAELDGTVHPLPLLDSHWSFTEQCKALKESKEVPARQVVVMIRLDLDLFQAKLLQDADGGAP
jgi:hypothetical protein